MTQDYSLNELFRAGLSREQFLDNYAKMQSNSSDMNSSIFGKEMSNTVAQIFDTINTDGNGTIDETEISALKALSTEDGQNTLSEADLKVLYEKIAQNIKSTAAKGPEELYADSIAKVDTPQESSEIETLANQIAVLNELVTAREKNSNAIIKNYQAQIDDIVQKALSEKTKEDKDFKDRYKQKSDELKKLQKESEENSAKLQDAQENKKETSTEIEIIKQENSHLDPERDKERIEANNKDLNALQSKLKNYDEDVSIYAKTENVLNSKMANSSAELSQMTQKVEEKLESIDKTQAERVKNLKLKIESERESAKKDIAEYKETIKRLEEAQKYAISKMQELGYAGDDSSFHMNDGKFNFGDVKYSSAKGQQLAQYMRAHAHGFTGHCARAVRLGLQGTGLGTEGAASAWMMADKLRGNKNYKEIKVHSKEELQSLPAGCIIVYGAGAAGYNAKHGHIEVTLGDGTAASDGITRNQRYTENMSVFVPVD